MKHNKKRNVGIVYEMLLKYISNNLIEGDRRKAKVATRILEKYYASGTQINKEYRLYNALTNTKITNTHTAASILNEAKSAARNNFNKKQLEEEKNSMLREINYKLGKEFYYQKIKNYRELGTVQLAINEWQKKDPNIKRLVEFETKIGESMLTKNHVEDLKVAEASHTDKLVLKIMTEKFNKVYKSQLTPDQKSIIRNYVFASENDNNQLLEFFSVKKLEALSTLSSFEEKTDNKHLLQKLDRVKMKINELSTNSIDDQKVTRFLTLTKMINEIKKEL